MKKLFLGLALLGTLATVNAATTAWLLPSANGTYSSWSPSSSSTKYTFVDESTCNGNVDYVSTHTLNARESYSVPLTSIPDGYIISAVYVAPCALQDTVTTATSSLSMFTVVNGVSSSYAGTYFLKGTSTPSPYSYAYIPNAPVIKNASTKVEAGVVLVSGQVGGARLSRISAVVVYTMPAPASPTNLVATKSATSSTSVLTWKDNSTNESGFYIERSTNGVTFSIIANVGANSSRYVTGPQTAGTYYYRVRANNVAGYSAYSNIASVIIPVVVTIPAAPSGLSVSTASSTNLLYWNDNSTNETAFVVEKSNDGVIFKSYATTTNPYFIETDKAPGIYYYRVRAFNNAGYSAYSSVAVLRINPLIAAPSAIIAKLSDPAIPTKYIELSWTDNSIDEAGFMIERSTNGTTWTHLATTTYASVPFFGDSEATLTAGTYYYRVRAYNALGYSAYSSSSAPVTVTPPVAPSAIIAKLSDPAIPTKYIELSWTDNSIDEAGFMIERSTNGTTWTHLATTTYASVPFFGDSEATLTAGTYYYRVRAYNALGYSAYSSSSAPVTVTPPVAPSAITAVLYNSNSIGVTWVDNSSDELGFLLERSNDGTLWTQFATSTFAFFSDSNLLPGLYLYQVRAYNNLGLSSYSGTSTAIFIQATATTP